MASEKFRSKLLGEINALVDMKPSEESINIFARKILALLMKDYHLQWVDINSLLGNLTKSLDITSDESSIKEIVSREICSLFDSRPTAALITKKGEANIVLFIGITKGHPNEDPRGYGKTTAIVRYALRYRNDRSGKDHVPYVVCADARRHNAFTKLKQLSGGRVNGYTPDEKEGAIGGLYKAFGSLGKRDTTALVIMDVNARHLDEISQKMVSLNCDYSIIVVLDGTVESKEISNQIEIYRNAKLLNGLAFIITKMDLHLGFGAIMTAAKGRYPIAMIGTGEGVDDYIYQPNVESFLRECLSFDQTQISSDAILQESAENSLSSSKEAGEEINWDSPKIGSTKPAAKKQILDTEALKIIDVDQKKMNTNEIDQKEENEPSKVGEGAEKSFFEAHIRYVIEGYSCRAKYLDGRDDNNFVIVKVFENDVNTLRFYQSASHTNLLPYRFDHKCVDGSHNVSFAKFDVSLEDYLRELAVKLIGEYTLLSNQSPNIPRRTTKYLPPVVRKILKDIVNFMVFLLKKNQEVNYLSLNNMGVKDDNVVFYDLSLCERTGSDDDDNTLVNASRLGPVFSKLIVSIFKQFGFDVAADGSYDLQNLVLQLKNFTEGFKAYQNGIKGMTIQAKDWCSQFRAEAPELRPVNSVFFHAKQSDAETSSSSPSQSDYSNSGASLLTFCRCLCHHLYEKFHEDGHTLFDTLDVDLTVMALFDRELLDVHEKLCSILEIFLT
ncbi:hypothetical protein OROGR_033221 [Orobanche gracilis]